MEFYYINQSHTGVQNFFSFCLKKKVVVIQCEDQANQEDNTMKKMDRRAFEEQNPGMDSKKLFNKVSEFIQKLKELHEFLSHNAFLTPSSFMIDNAALFSAESICLMFSLNKRLSDLSSYRDEDNFITMLSYLFEVHESELENIFFLFLRICEQYQANIVELFKKRLDYTRQLSLIRNELDKSTENIPHHSNKLPQLFDLFCVQKNEIQETLYKFNKLMNLFPTRESTKSDSSTSLAQQSSEFSALPNEILLDIFNYLNTDDLASVLTTSKELSCIATISFADRFEKKPDQIVAHICNMKPREAYQFVKEYRLSTEYKALKNLIEYKMPMSNIEITCYILTRCHKNLPDVHQLAKAFNDTSIHYRARIHLLFTIINTPNLNGKLNSLSPFLGNEKDIELFTRLIKNCTKIYLNYLPPDNLFLDDLSADMSYAPLSRFQFHETYHDPAVFNQSNFFHADLSHSKINRAELNDTNWHNTNCYRAEMCESSLKNARLENTNFQKANLTNADFSYAKLINANLRWANLSGAKFVNTIITDSDFTGANLIHAKFVNVDLRNIDLKGLNLDGSYLENVLLIPDSALENLKNLESFWGSFEKELSSQLPGSQQNIRKHMLEDLASFLNSDWVNTEYKREIVHLVFSYYPPELFSSSAFQKDTHPFQTLFESFEFIPEQNKTMNTQSPLQEKVIGVLNELDQRIKNSLIDEQITRSKNQILNGLKKRIQDEVQKIRLTSDLQDSKMDELITNIECSLQNELVQRTLSVIENELTGRFKSQKIIEDINWAVKEGLRILINQEISPPPSLNWYSNRYADDSIAMEDFVDTLEQCITEAPGLFHINQICELSSHHLYLLHTIYHTDYRLSPKPAFKPFFVNYISNSKRSDRGTCHFASQIFDGEDFDITLLQNIQPEERDAYLYGDEDFIISQPGRSWNEVKLGGLLFSFCPGGKGSGECKVNIIDFQNKQLKSGFNINVARYSSLRYGLFLPIDITAHYNATTTQSALYPENIVDAKAAFELKRWTINYIFATQKGAVPELFSTVQEAIVSSLIHHSTKEKPEKVTKALQPAEKKFDASMNLFQELREALRTDKNIFLYNLSHDFRMKYVTPEEQMILKNALIRLLRCYELNAYQQWIIARYLHKTYNMPIEYYNALKRIIIYLPKTSKNYQEAILRYLSKYAKDTKNLKEYFINLVIDTIQQIPNPAPDKFLIFYRSLRHYIVSGSSLSKINNQILLWKLHISKQNNPVQQFKEAIESIFLSVHFNKLYNPLDPQHNYYRISKEAIESIIDLCAQCTTNEQNANQIDGFYKLLLHPKIIFSHGNIRSLIENAFQNLKQSIHYQSSQTSEVNTDEMESVEQKIEMNIEEIYEMLFSPPQVACGYQDEVGLCAENWSTDTFGNSTQSPSSFQTIDNRNRLALSAHGLFALTASGKNKEMKLSENIASMKLR